MAIDSRARFEMARHWKQRDISPERTKVWAEPRSKVSGRRVPVVYYLSRNGHLEHPHFMEVPLSSPDGLHLKDFTNRLNVLRGKGMASLYSWSSKRSYKNGFVWQDLCEHDLIYPAHGDDYVLKGSESFNFPSPPTSQDSVPSSSPSSADRHDYKVCRSELIADASTQTDDKRGRRRSRAAVRDREPNPSSGDSAEEIEIEISPPPPSSSPEAVESLTTANGGAIAGDRDRAVGSCSSGRFRASAVLMQLVSCGSISVKENMVTRGGLDSGRREMDGGIGVSMGFEDKEYFSGSLIETHKKSIDFGGAGGAIPTLKRSHSYDADRTSKVESGSKETEVARAKCIPIKTKAVAGRREETASICRSSRGSFISDYEQQGCVLEIRKVLT